MKNIIIFSDLDGVITQNVENAKIVLNSINNIEKFFMNLKPVDDIYLLQNFLKENAKKITFFIITARPIILFDITKKWLNKNSIPFCSLYCCGSAEEKINTTFKINPDFFIDDKKRIIEQIKKRNTKTISILFESWKNTLKIISCHLR
ncbi:MAG: hypothetical protein QXG16_04900 [Candidatus Anstonellaceae archaeon]